MTTAADVIAALDQRRLLKQGRIETPGEMPIGWQRWFDAMPQADARAARARIEDWVAPLAQRLTYPQGGAVRLALPFFHLQRLARPEDPRDERGLRVGVGVLDILLHLLLAGLLLWLMYLRFMALAQQEQEQGSVVQVEFIGRGNAAAGGGGLADAGATAVPVPMPVSAVAATAAAAADAVPALAPPAATAPAEIAPVTPALARQELPVDHRLEVTQAAPTLAMPSQVLRVSEVPQPQPGDFKLPPPRERSVSLPQAQVQEVRQQQQVESLATLRTQPASDLQVAPREVQLRAPELQQQVQALEVFAPNRDALTHQRAAPVAEARAAQVPQLQSQLRDLPLRQEAAAQPAAGKVTTPAGAVAGGQTKAGSGQGARAAASEGRGVLAAGAGAGPGAKPAPGGWTGAAKTDDWGAARRNSVGTGGSVGTEGGRAGDGRSGDGKSGLFNADGSARLPDAWSKGDGIDLDRAGTWLQRPGLEYRGTRFDKYWIPSGTLLEEWVRKGVKQLSIPIPGSKLKLQCVISLLQFGGGCMPVNPDANEQSSTGRKAPEVPFKPGLQEDNGSVRPPPTVPAGN